MKACIFGGKVQNKNINRHDNLNRVGLNNGNMLFWHSLNSILDSELKTLGECLSASFDGSQYNSYITTDLIWIREGATFPVVNKQLEIAGDKPLIPISIGLQTATFKNDFKLHSETVALLAKLQERAVLGVRGSYTAEILNKYNIKNIEIIGCPSMYLPFDYNFQITKRTVDLKNVAVNLRSLYSKLDYKEIKFLVYSANHKFSFVEQTAHPLSREICVDMPTFDYLIKWLNDYKLMFFDIEDWKSFMSTVDFSMGCRFHGNVIALWEKKPALFVTIDSRTKELCNHFSLPTISLKDFDEEKDIQYYYDLADYTEFNKNYSSRLHEFIDFLKKNKLIISKNCNQYYDKKILELEKKLEKGNN